LAAGDQTYLPIVQYGEALDKKKYDCADTMIEVCCTGKAPLLQIEEENILTIRATAHDVPFHEIQCAVWVDRSGKLRIRELELAKDDEMSLLEAATQAYERQYAGASTELVLLRSDHSAGKSGSEALNESIRDASTFAREGTDCCASFVHREYQTPRRLFDGSRTGRVF
jgi:hypothetical protein